jgi:hypothetical protein
VSYQGDSYQITNHFFPFKTAVLKKWNISDSDIARSLKQDDADRFMANWLAAQKLDSACEALLSVAREIDQSFYKNFKDLETTKYKVEHWDAGWWQIKRCLTEAGLEEERFAQIEEMKKPIGIAIAAEATRLGIIQPV